MNRSFIHFYHLCNSFFVCFFFWHLQFEKYCAPILNVGGLSIDIVKTDSEGHARRYIEELDVLPHSILCGGGDGTLAEIVTGEFCTSLKTETPVDSFYIYEVRETSFTCVSLSFPISPFQGYFEDQSTTKKSIQRSAYCQLDEKIRLASVYSILSIHRNWKESKDWPMHQ